MPRRPIRRDLSLRPPPYVSWRGGRPRFNPDRKLRDAGLKGQDLRHGPAGPWFTLDECRAWWEARKGHVASARAGRVAAPPPRRDCVKDLLRDYMLSPDWRAKAASTQARERQLHRQMVEEVVPAGALRLADAEVAIVEAADVKGFFLKAEREHGLTSARLMVMLLSAAFSWGRTDQRWRLKGDNPCHRLRLPTPPPRVFVWTWESLLAFIAAADDLDLPFIGDAVMLGVFSGQRQGDRLKLLDSALDDEMLAFRQAKRGALVEIPQHVFLERRLTAGRERRRALPHTVIAPYVLIDETTGRAMSQDRYHSLFSRVRAHAVERAQAEGDNWMAVHLAAARDQDLRDTIVTWMVRAECTMAEVVSITGHSLRSIMSIMKHYLLVDRTLSVQAIQKVTGWMTKTGMEM